MTDRSLDPSRPIRKQYAPLRLSRTDAVDDAPSPVAKATNDRGLDAGLSRGGARRAAPDRDPASPRRGRGRPRVVSGPGEGARSLRTEWLRLSASARESFADRNRPNRKQYAGLCLSPDWVRKPSLALPYLRQVAADGYRGLFIFPRHMKMTVFDAPVHDAVKAITAAGQRLGLEMLLDDDPKWWGLVCAERSADAAMRVIQPVEANVLAGAFEIHVPFPPMGKGQILFDHLAVAFILRNGRYVPVPPAKLRLEWTNMGGKPRWSVCLRGMVPNAYQGPLVLYPVFRSFGWPDMAHPLYLRMQKELLDLYADVPLDGFGWDEPGAGKESVTGYKTGTGFERLFHRFCGYELNPNLIYLDHGDGSGKAAQVRHDYYRALAEMHYQAQQAHNNYARRLAKRPLVFGTHQTHSGIPSDLGNGIMDYFRWGKVLTAAWTDGSWDCLPRNLLFHLMLADGIRKELGLRDAYYNDWTASLPAVENMRFATRCKMLFHVNWFNIFFSDYNESEASPLSEPLHTESRKEVANLDRFDAFLNGQFRARGDVALLYSWEGIATAPLRVSRAYFAAIQNAALCLADRNIGTDILSPASFAHSRAGKDGFAVNGQRYKAIVVPYPHALPEATYKALLAIAAAGSPVIVFGVPPQFTLGKQGARSVGDDFARRVGFRPFSQQDFLDACTAQGPLAGANEWEPGWMDAVFPAAITTGRETLDREGRLLCVRAPQCPLHYMPVADPRDDLCNLIEDLVPRPVEAFAERTYYRLFEDVKIPARQVLVLAAKGYVSGDVCETDEMIIRHGRKRQPVRPSTLRALFRLAGGTLTITGGTWCAVKLENGIPVTFLGDSNDVRWNGTRVATAK